MGLCVGLYVGFKGGRLRVMEVKKMWRTQGVEIRGGGLDGVEYLSAYTRNRQDYPHYRPKPFLPSFPRSFTTSLISHVSEHQKALKD